MQLTDRSESSREGHFRAKKENCGVEHGEQPHQRLQTVCWIHTHTVTVDTRAISVPL